MLLGIFSTLCTPSRCREAFPASPKQDLKLPAPAREWSQASSASTQNLSTCDYQFELQYYTNILPTTERLVQRVSAHSFPSLLSSHIDIWRLFAPNVYSRSLSFRPCRKAPSLSLLALLPRLHSSTDLGVRLLFPCEAPLPSLSLTSAVLLSLPFFPFLGFVQCSRLGNCLPRLTTSALHCPFPLRVPSHKILPPSTVLRSRLSQSVPEVVSSSTGMAKMPRSEAVVVTKGEEALFSKPGRS